MRLHEGEIIAGKYRIERVLGSGSSGNVYAATHLGLETIVALKILVPDRAADRTAVKRLVREAQMLTRLRSPHVVRVLDVSAAESSGPYIVMEYLEGQTFERLLLRRRRLYIPEAVDFVAQACEGVAEAHSLGIVHRDIKPANLFLVSRGAGKPLVKVLDFGISKIPFAKDTLLTATHQIVGTPLYMSPEQLESSKTLDARSDVWALGAVLYQLLAGRPPFVGNALPSVFLAILQKEPAPLHQLRPRVGMQLSNVVSRCLERDRDQRYASATELLASLRDVQRTKGFKREPDAEDEIDADGDARMTTMSSTPSPRGDEKMLPRHATENWNDEQRTRTSQAMLRKHHVTESHAVGSWKNMFLLVWTAKTTVADVERARRGLTELAEVYVDGVGLLQLVEATVHAPDGAARAAISEMLRSPGDRLKCSSVVFEGRGFLAATARAVATGIALLARPHCPHVVFSSLDHAAEWHLGHLKGDRTDPRALVDAVRSLRNAMCEPPPHSPGANSER